MFGMSMTEIVIILVVALIVVGPKELPNIARTLGKSLRDLRRAGDDLRDTFEREVMQEPVRPKEPPPDVLPAGRDPRQLLQQAHQAPAADAAEALTEPSQPADTPAEAAPEAEAAKGTGA